MAANTGPISFFTTYSQEAEMGLVFRCLVAGWIGCAFSFALWLFLMLTIDSWGRRMQTDDAPLEHITNSDGACWCNPTTEPIKRPDGSYGWMIVHRDLVQELINHVEKNA